MQKMHHKQRQPPGQFTSEEIFAATNRANFAFIFLEHLHRLQ